MKKWIQHTIALGLIFALGLTAGCGQKKSSTADFEVQAEPGAAEDNEGTAESPAEETLADQLSSIQKSGKFVVGVEGTYPPFTYHDDNGDLTGFDVEIAKAVAEKLGVEAEFSEAAWDSLLAGVDSGRLDTVINCVSITEEREEKYDFSNPYFFITRQIIVGTDNDEIKAPEDLDNKTIAVNSTHSFAGWFEEQGATIVPIDAVGEAIELVLSGRADCTSFSSIVLADYLKEHPDAALKVAFEIPDSEEASAIPIRKNEARLLEAVNQALEDLKADGTLAALSEKYFGSDYTTSSTAQ